MRPRRRDPVDSNTDEIARSRRWVFERHVEISFGSTVPNRRCIVLLTFIPFPMFDEQLDLLADKTLPKCQAGAIGERTQDLDPLVHHRPANKVLAPPRGGRAWAR